MSNGFLLFRWKSINHLKASGFDNKHFELLGRIVLLVLIIGDLNSNETQHHAILLYNDSTFW